MSSNYYTEMKERKVSGGKKYQPPKASKRSVKIVEKTANWPGLPGKSGPNRSAGVRKVKAYPKSAGI